jgi:hypothetical protein
LTILLKSQLKVTLKKNSGAILQKEMTGIPDGIDTHFIVWLEEVTEVVHLLWEGNKCRSDYKVSH